jgi:hypothetical protein
MVRGVLAIAALLAMGLPAAAQTAPTGRLLVTVVDPSGGVIPGATVVVVPPSGSLTTASAPVVTSGAGVATLDALAPGTYTIQIEFPGFETVQVRSIRVKAGDNTQKVKLPIKKLDEAVTVGRDKQSGQLDPQGNAFSTVLTREQIAALPDDPDEMEAMLKNMAPPGASIRVDGFTGGKMPPKSQIRSIRLPRMDMTAAQNHGGLNGMMFIDILTQPGLGPIRGGLDFTFRDDGLNARNPYAASKGDEGLQQYGASLSGTIVDMKSSFSLTVQSARQHDTANLFAALPTGTLAEPVRRPTDRTNFTGRFDQSINKDHAMRFSVQRNAFTNRNLGVGGFDLSDRAYTQGVADSVFRASENGPLGKRFFSESRLQLHWTRATSQSLVEAPAIRVNDAFTSGGAQQSGGSHTFEFEAASDLDYVRGKHSARFGVLLEGGRYHSNASSNYLGTYTFASLADYQAGRPASYTRRIGDPDVRYSNVQLGVYAQDDIRVARSLLFSAGLRYEAQGLIRDQQNFSPRFSLTWSPLKSGKTTFRAGGGLFSDWLGTGTYEQTLRVDGFRQRQLNVFNPAYPDPGLSGTTPPTDRYLLGSGLVLPESASLNAGVEQLVTSTLRVNASYTYRRGSHLLRGQNLNAPLNMTGTRPDAAFANEIAVVSDASSRSHVLNIGANLMLQNWHRTFFFVNYGYVRARGNAMGAFSLPANGDDLDAEWGPTSPRHRFNVTFSTQPIRNLSVNLTLRGQSGSPYTITTGLDNNRDGVFNDRPAGTGRNSVWTSGQWDIGGRVSYAIGFGGSASSSGGPGGMMVVMRSGGGGPGGPEGGFSGGADDKRYRMEFYAAASNLTNRRNDIGYSGVMTSPFFRQPTNAANPRKVELGVRFGF